MTLFEYYDRQIPDYYDGMYLDGYTPAQIHHAAARKIMKEYYAQQEALRTEAEQDLPVNVKIISEVRIK